MAAGDVNKSKLKKQLQGKTAERRARNVAETKVAAAKCGKGRNDLQPVLCTVLKPPGDLKPSANRTRETTAQMLEGAIRSLKTFGMVLPILIDKHNTIVAGHAIWEAAKELGLDSIECRIVDHLDSPGCEALSLALNRIGELGKYDLDKLRDRMIAIESAGIELISTGFTVPEIDQIKLKPLISQNESESEEGEGEEEDEALCLPVSISGDLFKLGRNRLLCGDALEEAAYQQVLDDGLAAAVFSDPPYGCKIAGFVGGLGKHKHPDFLQFAGKETAIIYLS